MRNRPPNDTPVLALDAELRRWVVAYWNTRMGWFSDWDNSPLNGEPEEWRELPEVPTDAALLPAEVNGDE